jgi:hypothetical protein
MSVTTQEPVGATAIRPFRMPQFFAKEIRAAFGALR